MFIDVSDLHSLKAEFSIVVTPSAIHQLIRMDYENMHLFRLSRVDRNRIANLILRYYRIHVPNMPDLNSLQVLSDLFD